VSRTTGYLILQGGLPEVTEFHRPAYEIKRRAFFVLTNPLILDISLKDRNSNSEICIMLILFTQPERRASRLAGSDFAAVSYSGRFQGQTSLHLGILGQCAHEDKIGRVILFSRFRASCAGKGNSLGRIARATLTKVESVITIPFR